jgi:4'-phosphopantetheinyl transferase
MSPVRVYVTTVEEARPRLAAYHARLTDEERARHARMRPDPRGDEFLVGRALARHALALEAPGTPAIFSSDRLGRLRLPGTRQLNLSHAAGLVVCAVADGDVGADVEKVDAARVDEGVWKSYFAPIEVAALAALPPEARTERFFRYWTLKEAYIKARGQGMGIPLDQFWFALEAGAPLRIAFAPALDDRPGRWQFAQQFLSPDFLLAVALETSAPLALSIERCVP